MNDITYTRAQLDELLIKIEPSLGNRTDFATLRDLAYAVVMGEYNQELIEKADDHVIDDNFSSPLSTGTAVINTTIGDVFKATLPTGEIAIMGDIIWLQQGTGTFLSVPRVKIADVVIGGTDETLYSFSTHTDVITLYSKDAEFTAPGNLAYFFYRKLESELLLTTTVLDIKSQDFNSIAERVSEYMRTD